MQVKSIAECFNGSILQYFRSSLSYHLSLRTFEVQWLCGRVLDSRQKGHGFERHCVVVLEQDTFILA